MNKNINNDKAPKFARKLLGYFLPGYLNSTMLEDYAQMFEHIAGKHGVRKARQWYWLQTLKTLPLYTKESIRWSAIMLKNYFKIAMRNVIRHKSYAFINIMGLAVGLACATVILFYVIDETGYDSYHENKDNLYRISIELGMYRSGFESRSSLFWGFTMKSDYPEVEEFARISTRRFNYTFVYGDKTFIEHQSYHADASIFTMFSWPLLYGDPETALKDKNSIVISESVAKKFFGDVNPVGKILNQKYINLYGDVETEVDYTVTGVMQDIPRKTHIRPDVLMSIQNMNEGFGGDLVTGAGIGNAFWRYRQFYTYLRLQDGADPAATEAKFPGFLEKYPIDRETVNRGYRYYPFLQKITDIHLMPNFAGEPGQTTGKTTLYMFLAIATLILFIACTNFTNLSVAKSVPRAKEIGIRKVVGAIRPQLVKQFLGESILLSFIALFVAAGIAVSVIPTFFQYVGKELVLTKETILPVVPVMLTLTLLTGLFAGSYPAFFISAYRPVAVLKNALKTGAKGALLRKGLIVMQFSISVFLIISTFTVFHQVQFMKSQDLGFEKEQVVVLTQEFARPLRDNFAIVKTELRKSPYILSATASSTVPGENRGADIYAEEGQPGNTAINLEEYFSDIDFLDLYGLELIAGRTFSPEISSDVTGLEWYGGTGGSAVILNEEAVRRFGWSSPEEAIGKRIIRDPASKDFTATVIGVIKDFHFRSLETVLEPASIQLVPSYNYISIKISPTNIQETIQYIEKTMSDFVPFAKFSYSFLDENFDRLYASQEKMGQIFSYISLLAIIIACMGLFGLASFTTEARAKEIGIRKVLGATTVSITTILSKEYIFLIAIANVITWPLAYTVMQRFLDSFAYKTSLSWELFVITGVTALGIALATISFKTLQAALINPVKTLRSE